jgi:hypothetical protein
LLSAFFSPDADSERVADKKAHAKIDVGRLIDNQQTESDRFPAPTPAIDQVEPPQPFSVDYLRDA